MGRKRKSEAKRRGENEIRENEDEGGQEEGEMRWWRARTETTEQELEVRQVRGKKIKDEMVWRDDREMKGNNNDRDQGKKNANLPTRGQWLSVIRWPGTCMCVCVWVWEGGIRGGERERERGGWCSAKFQRLQSNPNRCFTIIYRRKLQFRIFSSFSSNPQLHL